jgi:hypothetical protein
MAAVLEKKEKEKQQLLASKLVNLLNVEVPIIAKV